MANLRIPLPATFATVEEERLHRKQRLAAALRLFAHFGYEEGVAGHITARDPELTDHFWVNPFGEPFAHVRVRTPLRDDRAPAARPPGSLNRSDPLKPQGFCVDPAAPPAAFPQILGFCK